MSETPTATAAQAPTIYFIDDSATMREVIKIAFRKENIQVVTCPSVAAAIEQFGAMKPDAVISDVIMPDRDGYELCSYIKGHAELGNTPVILMSGVVNRTVAERATVAGANELLRKPFQPQELVARVKKLLPAAGGQPESAADEPVPAAALSTANAASGLEKLFSPPAPVTPVPAAVPPSPSAAAAAPKSPAAPAPRAAAPVPPPTSAIPSAPVAAPSGGASARPPAQVPGAPSAEAQKLRFEIQRLELLVKKLQTELEAERQYCQALESHIRTLQGSA